MRRVNNEEGDIFKPIGQLKDEIELACNHTNKVIDILSSRLSVERKNLIHQVVQNRIVGLTAVIEGVSDPHNTAAVIRTAEAFGMQTIHIIENDAIFQSTRRVTRGTHKWLDYAVWKDAETCAYTIKKQGKRIITAEAGGRISLFDLDPHIPTAFVFGNERKGISEKMRSLADDSFFIPMKGFAESLNVSVAAAVTIQTLCRNISGDLSDREKEILRARYYLRAVSCGYEIVNFVMNNEKRI